MKPTRTFLYKCDECKNPTNKLYSKRMGVAWLGVCEPCHEKTIKTN